MNQSLNILQVFDFLSLPHGGGSVDIVYTLSKTLTRRGHNVTICTGDYELDKPYLERLDGVDVEVHHSYFNRFGIYVMPGIRKLDVSRFDVAHLHCYRSFQNAILGRKLRKAKVPYVVDAHGSTVPARGTGKHLIHTLYDTAVGIDLLAGASYLIAETEVGVGEFLDLWRDRGKIKVLHPLLDTGEFDNLPPRGVFRRKYQLGDKFTVLFVGRVHEAKGIQTLVDAVHRILHSIPELDARLVIVGQDDGFRTQLEYRIHELGIGDRVCFTGFLTGMDKLEALVDANVLVQPSRNEAGARPSLEAILCGTPVIVTLGTGAGKEIARFDGGLLYEYGNVETLVDCIYSVYSRQGEAKERTTRAAEYIRANLSADVLVQEYENLYWRMLR